VIASACCPTSFIGLGTIATDYLPIPEMTKLLFQLGRRSLLRTASTRSGPKGRVLHMSAPGPHHQCAFSTASTDVTPAIIEPVIATSAGTPCGNSRLISEAMKIAAMGRAMTK
jgi:hypothetical protein